MVWGSISHKGTVHLARIRGNLNAEKYVDILCGEFYDQALVLFPHGDWRFTQYNARPHTARATMRWIYENMPAPLDHIPNSPDLNPIEMLWAILINWVDRQHPKTTEQLWVAIQRAWQRVTPELCNKIIDDLYPTMEGIISSGGVHITSAEKRRYREK